MKEDDMTELEMNFIERAKINGTKAAQARHYHDESLAQFLKREVDKMANLCPNIRTEIMFAYSIAYRAESESYC